MPSKNDRSKKRRRVPTAFQGIVDRARQNKRRGGSLSQGPSGSLGRRAPSRAAPSRPAVSVQQQSTPSNANFSSVDGSAQFVPPPSIPDNRSADALFDQALNPQTTTSFGLAQNALAQQRPESGFDIQQALDDVAIFAPRNPDGSRKTWDQYTTSDIMSTVGISAGTVTKLTASKIATNAAQAVNPKGTTIATKMFGKLLSKQGLVTAGVVAASAWAGSVGMGLWGRGESTEGADFLIQNELRDEAVRTGNWSAYNEFVEHRDEIKNLDLWQELALYSPASAIVGSALKIQGTDLQNDIERHVGRTMQEWSDSNPGQAPNAQFWMQRDQEKFNMEKELQDRYVELNKQLTEWRLEAEADANRENANFWAHQQKLAREAEAREREEIAEFWLEYRKQMLALNESTRPSNLKFGLL